jgi:hypothetical protein
MATEFGNYKGRCEPISPRRAVGVLTCSQSGVYSAIAALLRLVLTRLQIIVGCQNCLPLRLTFLTHV